MDTAKENPKEILAATDSSIADLPELRKEGI
jgi:hypothetical protein